MLWYLPIEPYEERYTKQLDDWVTEKLEKKGIKYQKVTVSGFNSPTTVNRGQVLDAIGRPAWCLQQTQTLLKAMASGQIQKGDKIFTMDIWQFGLETVAYASQQLGLDLEFYGFNCAGSFEWYDFINLTGIGKWGQHLERAWFEFYTKVFFASEKLRNMAFNANMFTDKRKAVITGLAFNSKYVLDTVRMPSNDKAFSPLHKSKTVIFPHRYDFEKNPDVFCDVVEKLSDQGINFAITTGRKSITGTANYKRALKLQEEKKLTIYTDLPKTQYYQLLLNSMIVFSSAKQDTIGNCILESITLGCTPVVNTGVSYEEFLPKKYIYTDGCIDEACNLILKYINEPSNAFSYIKRYDKSIDNMLKEMGY